MQSLSISDEPIESSGALSVLHAAVDELHRRYGGTDEGPRLGTDELKPPLGVFLVARVDGHPAGGVGLRPIGDPALRVGEVKRLWVRPDLRRSGVASALMIDIEQRARDLGYRQLYLETGDAQPEAKALYPNIGWHSVDAFPPDAFSHPNASRFTRIL